MGVFDPNDDKPFKCNTCGGAFQWHQDLRLHQRVTRHT